MSDSFHHSGAAITLSSTLEPTIPQRSRLTILRADLAIAIERIVLPCYYLARHIVLLFAMVVAICCAVMVLALTVCWLRVWHVLAWLHNHTARLMQGIMAIEQQSEDHSIDTSEEEIQKTLPATASGSAAVAAEIAIDNEPSTSSTAQEHEVVKTGLTEPEDHQHAKSEESQYELHNDMPFERMADINTAAESECNMTTFTALWSSLDGKITSVDSDNFAPVSPLNNIGRSRRAGAVKSLQVAKDKRIAKATSTNPSSPDQAPTQTTQDIIGKLAKHEEIYRPSGGYRQDPDQARQMGRWPVVSQLASSNEPKGVSRKEAEDSVKSQHDDVCLLSVSEAARDPVVAEFMKKRDLSVHLPSTNSASRTPLSYRKSSNPSRSTRSTDTSRLSTKRRNTSGIRRPSSSIDHPNTASRQGRAPQHSENVSPRNEPTRAMVSQSKASIMLRGEQQQTVIARPIQKSTSEERENIARALRSFGNNGSSRSRTNRPDTQTSSPSTQKARSVSIDANVDDCKEETQGLHLSLSSARHVDDQDEHKPETHSLAAVPKRLSATAAPFVMPLSGEFEAKARNDRDKSDELVRPHQHTAAGNENITAQDEVPRYKRPSAAIKIVTPPVIAAPVSNAEEDYDSPLSIWSGLDKAFGD